MAIKPLLGLSLIVFSCCVVIAAAQPVAYEVTVTTENLSGYQSSQDSGDGILSFRIDAENPGIPTNYLGSQTFPFVNLTVNQAIPGTQFTGARIENYQFRVRVRDIDSNVDVVIIDGDGDAIGNITDGIVSVAVIPNITDVTDPLNPTFPNPTGGNYVINTLVGTTPYTVTFSSVLSLPPEPPLPGTIFPYSMTITVPEPSSLLLLWGLVAVASIRRMGWPS